MKVCSEQKRLGESLHWDSATANLALSQLWRSAVTNIGFIILFSQWGLFSVFSAITIEKWSHLVLKIVLTESRKLGCRNCSKRRGLDWEKQKWNFRVYWICLESDLRKIDQPPVVVVCLLLLFFQLIPIAVWVKEHLVIENTFIWALFRIKKSQKLKFNPSNF